MSYKNSETGPRIPMLDTHTTVVVFNYMKHLFKTHYHSVTIDTIALTTVTVLPYSNVTHR